MGEIVNRTYKKSLDWQAPLTWLRANQGYLRSELEDLAPDERDTERIRVLLRLFDVAHERFINAEVNLFAEARTAEREEKAGSIKKLVAPLKSLRGCFQEFIQAYHAEVQSRMNDDNLLKSLLLGCGSEILGAHTAVVKAVDEYRTEIETT